MLHLDSRYIAEAGQSEQQRYQWGIDKQGEHNYARSPQHNLHSQGNLSLLLESGGGLHCVRLVILIPVDVPTMAGLCPIRDAIAIARC